jgi:hypothetical protein
LRAALSFCAQQKHRAFNHFVSTFVHRNFSNKSAMSFPQSGNICRRRWAKFSAHRQLLPGFVAGRKFLPGRIYPCGAKSMVELF